MSPNDLNDTYDWFYLLATLDIISIASHVWHSFHHDLRYISFDIDNLIYLTNQDIIQLVIEIRLRKIYIWISISVVLFY